MKPMFLTLTLVLGTVWAAPARDECPAILERAGVSEIYAPLVAHNIHSLTLEDIRYFFKEDATEENGIPTVNMDLDSDQRVLPNAPLAGYDEDFSTYGMKAFDRVMRNMNRTWWGISNTSPLNMVNHAFHMAEIWDHAAKQYKIVEKLLDPESDICGCVTDIENNDILNFLNVLAFQMRYPGITTGNKTITDFYLALGENRVKRGLSYYHSMDQMRRGTYSNALQLRRGTYSNALQMRSGTYSNALQMRSGTYSNALQMRRGAYDIVARNGFTDLKFDGFDFSLSDMELLRDVAEKLVDGAKVASSNIESAEQWVALKELEKHGLERTGYFDVAVFMFCMLN